MSDQSGSGQEAIVVHSSRFGDLTVPASSIIELPSGLVGFPRHHKFVMIDHKPPFSWLHSVEDPNLAFVVVDGFQFGEGYQVKPPYGDKECDIQEGEEYAILVLITVRPDPRQTTANLKAPVFVNLRTHKGVQVIIDDARYSTRFPLWAGEEEGEAASTKKDGAKEETSE